MPDIIEREYVSSPSEGRLYSRLVMSTSIRNAILERNQETQRNPGAINDLSFGRWALSVPELDNIYLVKKYPDLNSPDGPTKQRALAKFMASPESIPYRVHG
jgi:hypothetical protein